MLIPVGLLLLHRALEGNLQQLGSCLIQPPEIRDRRRRQGLGDAPVLTQVPAHFFTEGPALTAADIFGGNKSVDETDQGLDHQEGVLVP